MPGTSYLSGGPLPEWWSLSGAEPEPPPPPTPPEPESAITPSGDRLYRSIPSVFIKDEEVGFFGLHLCDAIMSMLQGLDSIVQDSPAGVHPMTGLPFPGLPRHCGWSPITDPRVCPDEWLEWCASLYGVSLTGHTTATQKRIQIEELPPQKRGGIEAMITAAEGTLTGTKTVSVIEQVEGDSYVLFFATGLSETPNEEATRAALLGQKPAGVRLQYQIGVAWIEATKTWSAVPTGVTWATVKSGDV